MAIVGEEGVFIERDRKMTSVSQQQQQQQNKNNDDGTWSLAKKIGWPWNAWVRGAIVLVAFIILYTSLQPPEGYERGKPPQAEVWREQDHKCWMPWDPYHIGYVIPWVLSYCLALTWSVFPLLSKCVYGFLLLPVCAMFGMDMPDTLQPLYSTVWTPWFTEYSYAFLLGMAVVNFVWRTKKWGLHWMAFIYCFYHPSGLTAIGMWHLIGSLFKYLNL